MQRVNALALGDRPRATRLDGTRRPSRVDGLALGGIRHRWPPAALGLVVAQHFFHRPQFLVRDAEEAREQLRRRAVAHEVFDQFLVAQDRVQAQECGGERLTIERNMETDRRVAGDLRDVADAAIGQRFQRLGREAAGEQRLEMPGVDQTRQVSQD